MEIILLVQLFWVGVAIYGASIQFVTNCYKLNEEKACLLTKKSVYYIVRFERVRGWVTMTYRDD